MCRSHHYDLHLHKGDRFEQANTDKRWLSLRIVGRDGAEVLDLTCFTDTPDECCALADSLLAAAEKIRAIAHGKRAEDNARRTPTLPAELEEGP